MSLTRLALKFAAPAVKLETYLRYLFIGPHPDDIEIGAGATAVKLAAEGKDVAFLICTDGRYGDGATALRGDELAEERRREAIASAKMLGVTDVRFIGLCDGAGYDVDELLHGIARTVGEFKPDVIFAPDPDVDSECHADHLNAGRCARQIACFAPYGGIMAGYEAERAPVKALAYYMTARPNTYVASGGYISRQLDAVFSCHKTQFPDGSADAKAIALYLKIRAADFGLRSLKGKAEGFRALSSLQMHCMPEAGL